jgi:hypothetical protein
LLSCPHKLEVPPDHVDLFLSVAGTDKTREGPAAKEAKKAAKKAKEAKDAVAKKAKEAKDAAAKEAKKAAKKAVKKAATKTKKLGWSFTSNTRRREARAAF